MADRELEKIFGDILRNELTIANDYGSSDASNPYSPVIPSVVIGFSNIDLKNTDKLQIAISFVDGQPICNNNYTDFSGATPLEIQEVLTRENIQIDMLSQNLDARQRRWEVIAALTSIYSKAQQELYNFSIFKMPTTWVNTSKAEGGSQLNRFTITVPCHIWYRKSKELVDYFDSFQTKLNNESTVVPSWDADSTYDIDDEVLYEVDRKYYKCLNNGVTTVPTNVTDWVEISAPDGIIDFTL